MFANYRSVTLYFRLYGDQSLSIQENVVNLDGYPNHWFLNYGQHFSPNRWYRKMKSCPDASIRLTTPHNDARQVLASKCNITQAEVT